MEECHAVVSFLGSVGKSETLLPTAEKNVVQQLRQHANDLLVVFQVACAAATFVHPSHLLL